MDETVMDKFHGFLTEFGVHFNLEPDSQKIIYSLQNYIL